MSYKLIHYEDKANKVHLGSISWTTGTYSPLLPHRHHWGSGLSCLYLCLKVVIDIATGTAIGSLTNAAILTIALLIAQLLCGAVDTGSVPVCKWKQEMHCAIASSPVYYKAVGTNWNAFTPATS